MVSSPFHSVGALPPTALIRDVITAIKEEEALIPIREQPFASNIQKHHMFTRLDEFPVRIRSYTGTAFTARYDRRQQREPDLNLISCCA